ncbi:uncharacterized protein with ATP-grasp and redox domains [Desulfobotulus alkaliphilus]|uniref:Uncharacterized protein with ATP-grasp and redox domains n=1 Tax=Desulfobotulus alkaliphilus TaxID=622671 RepID=A0A562RTB3_9BACT|nr:ARMT1-like domain-containing protein [Desulfobotulus alkaliphilus]TWI72292.1 uncharacterized protein with ATP-grasp and redox domains [Desulfobotulus alkaliphilus]
MDMKVDMKREAEENHKAAQAAWEAAFYIENHLDHAAYPEEVAPPEQVGFMVHTAPEERYYPCSEKMYQAIMGRNASAFLQQRYGEVLERILALVEDFIEKEDEKAFLKALIRIKFQHETRDELMIPSRIEKRLFRIFLNQTNIVDPYLEEKYLRNQWAVQVLSSKEFKDAFDFVDLSAMKRPPVSLGRIRDNLNSLELQRLFLMTGASELWQGESCVLPDKEGFLEIFSRPLTGEVKELFCFLGVRGESFHCSDAGDRKKILWLANEAGEIIMDLKIIRYLARLGHKIVVSFKGEPIFTKVDFADVMEDRVLQQALETARILGDPEISKNALVDILRKEENIIVISDGTRENVNLLLACTTFARAFKECDLIISRGEEQRRRFFDTHFQFTRPVFNICTMEGGRVDILHKPAPPEVIRFSHFDLERRAKAIIGQMKEAREGGMAVMFYSGIIGSIPGKIDEAKRIMTVFIDHLRTLFAKTFIINPSQYYEPGMDADDLMYMWEIVQRSGYIDIWRFQTYEDIAETFTLLGEKVPPEWVGKDATYSTGCTKEMHIAMDVLKTNPEMQLMGPPAEKFMRRKDYGVGKMHDKKL